MQNVSVASRVVLAAHERTRFRVNRFRMFLDMVDAILEQQEACRVVDLGGTQTYWAAFEQELRSRNVLVTVINLMPQVSLSEHVQCEVGDATDLAGYATASFDIVHSNSVIEHLGSRSRMTAFAGEVRRLAPAFFVQTPNFWFPFDPHSRTLFFHWLPVRARVALLMRRRCGFYPRAANRQDAIRHARDADCLTRSQLRRLFPDARIRGERLFGMTKSWMAIRAQDDSMEPAVPAGIQPGRPFRIRARRVRVRGP